jgi:hypothetical protein
VRYPRPRRRATAMRSLRTPCPASSGPAPGPAMVTSPSGSARQTSTLVVPSTSRAGRRPDELGRHAVGHVAGSARLRELQRRDVLYARATRGGAVELRASDVHDAVAGDLLASQLPAEHEPRQDHQLRHGVVALDVGGGIALGQARRLRLGECVVVAGAFVHPREDEVGGGIQQTSEPYRDRSREPVDQRAENRRAGHDGRLGAERHAAAAGQARELDPARRDGPLVRRHDRDCAPERLEHVREAGLAVRGRAVGDLDEEVGLGRAQALECGRQALDAGELGDRRPAGGKLERGSEIESVRVMAEPIARVGKANHCHVDPVLSREPRAARPASRAHG